MARGAASPIIPAGKDLEFRRATFAGARSTTGSVGAFMERIVRPRGQVLRSAAILAALLLAAGAASLLTGPAGAADCAGASATVPANADGWIDRGSATANKGSDSILKVQSKQPDVNSRARPFPLAGRAAGLRGGVRPAAPVRGLGERGLQAGGREVGLQPGRRAR